LVVLHEVWGLVPHIEDVCKRLSKLAFATLAPNLYWRHDHLLVPEKIRAAMKAVWDIPLEERYHLEKVAKRLAEKKASQETLEVVSALYDRRFRDQMLQDAISCALYARSRYSAVGSIGFSMGGGLSARLATRLRGLGSCIVFYGEPPEPSDVHKIECPLLAIYAERDEIINSKVLAFVQSAIASGTDLTLKVYPKTRHGFLNDTDGYVFNEEAANDAWELTEWFLKRTLARKFLGP